MLVSCYLSSKMKLWHFNGCIENVRIVYQFTLGLVHKLQQMQNRMKCFHFMVTEEINVNVLKPLTSKSEVQRARMKLTECPSAEDRVLIPTYSCRRRFSCCLQSVPFNKNSAKNHCESHPTSD